PLGPALAVSPMATAAGHGRGRHLDAGVAHHGDDLAARGAGAFVVDLAAALELLLGLFGRCGPEARDEKDSKDGKDEGGTAPAAPGKSHPSPLSSTTLSTTGKTWSTGARAKAFFHS